MTDITGELFFVATFSSVGAPDAKPTLRGKMMSKLKDGFVEVLQWGASIVVFIALVAVGTALMQWVFYPLLTFLPFGKAFVLAVTLLGLYAIAFAAIAVGGKMGDVMSPKKNEEQQ